MGHGGPLRFCHWVFFFQAWEKKVIRDSMKMFLGMGAAAFIVLAGTGASAVDIELMENVDIETVSRFVPHGTPGVDHPNGYAGTFFSALSDQPMQP